MRFFNYVCAVFLLANATILFADSSPNLSTVSSVRVYYLRHSLSCSNISSIMDGMAYRDSPLSVTGLKLAYDAGATFDTYLKKQNTVIDFLGASNLVRAKQTLLMLTHGRDFAKQQLLHEVAFLGESVPVIPWAFQQANVPHDPPQQRQTLLKTIAHFNPEHLSERYSKDFPRLDVDYEKYRTHILPRIVGDLQSSTPKARYNLAIVTHSLTMLNQLDCVRNPGASSPEKPTNNEVFFIDYTFSNETYPRLVSESSCSRAIEVPEAVPGPDDLAKCEQFR